MHDWLHTLIDWTSHQDYAWFLAGLAWCGVMVGAWGRGPRREGREPWLVWLAGAAMIEAGIELALYANNYTAPYFSWDFSLGLVQAAGLSALWWPLAERVMPSRPWLWRVIAVLVGVALAVFRIGAPVPAGLWIAIMAAGGVWVAMRAMVAMRVLTALSPGAMRRAKAGLVIVFLLPILSTFGPLAYWLGQGRRWIDFSPFELIAASANIIAAGSLALALWTGRLRAAPDASEAVAQRWYADLRLAFTMLAVWLALGLALAVANGRQARDAFEHNLLLRAQTAAALLDQDAVRAALGPELKPGQVRHAPLANGRQISVVRVPWALSPPFDILRRELRQLRAANNDTSYIYFASIVGGRVVLLASDNDQPENFVWRVIYREAAPADIAALAKGAAFLDGPFRDEWGAHFSANAFVVDRAGGPPVGWLTMTVPATVWATAFATARLQAMSVVAIGVALWVVAVVYRLRRAERELALLRAEQASAADRAKSEFLAQVSHELRAPLQGVFGYTDLLEMTALDSDQQGLLNSLRSQSTLMLRLANDLVDLGALQAGAFRLNPEPVELHGLVEECAASVRPRAETKGLKLACSLQPGVPAQVFTDGSRLRQVLLNLLGNAVKFTPEGKITLTVRCVESPAAVAGTSAPVPEWARADAWVEFAVADTGPGVAAEDQERIFQPFVRLDRDANIQGSGLGLALTGRLCHAMGGSVRVESDGEHGSTFLVCLPLGDSGGPGAMVKDSAEAGKAAAWPGLRVLVADDNTLVREMLTTFLRARGAQVAEAGDGLAAVEECRARSFDVVLLDVSMPWLDGHAAAKRLRQPGVARGRPWIIGLTADVRPEEEARAAAEGMNGFLIKPVSLATLERAVTSAPAARRPGQMVPADTAAAAAALRERLLEIYARETPRVVGELLAAARAHNWTALRSLAHYLKNSADLLGAGRLQRRCRELQAAVEQGDFARAVRLAAAVESAAHDPCGPRQERRLAPA